MSQPFFQMPAQTDGATSLGDLRVGSTGSAVRELQEILAALGLYTGELDGIYGDKTEGAVKAYQSNVGLTVSGVADAPTVASIQAQVPANAQQNMTALGPSLQQASAQQQPANILSTVSARWTAMPLWEKGLIIAGALAVFTVGLGFAKKAMSGGFGGMLGAADVERELSMQRRKCRAILPTGGDWTGGETVDANVVREEVVS